MRRPERQKLTPAMAAMVFSIWRRSLGLTDKLPRLYDFPWWSSTRASAPPTRSRFGTGPIRFLIPATRTEIGPGDRGARRAGRKLFQEVFFTDAEDRAPLAGFARLSPTTSRVGVMAETDVRLDASLSSGAGEHLGTCTSSAYALGGEDFVTGGFDLHVELADGLAAGRRDPDRRYDPLLSDAAVESVLGLPPEPPSQAVHGGCGRLVDRHLGQEAVGAMKFRILDGVPEDFDVSPNWRGKQYAMGYGRGKRA